MWRERRWGGGDPDSSLPAIPAKDTHWQPDTQSRPGRPWLHARRVSSDDVLLPRGSAPRHAGGTRTPRTPPPRSIYCLVLYQDKPHRVCVRRGRGAGGGRPRLPAGPRLRLLFSHLHGQLHMIMLISSLETETRLHQVMCPKSQFAGGGTTRNVLGETDISFSPNGVTSVYAKQMGSRVLTVRRQPRGIRSTWPRSPSRTQGSAGPRLVYDRIAPVSGRV